MNSLSRLYLHWLLLLLSSITSAFILDMIGAPAALMIGAISSGVFLTAIGFNLTLHSRCANFAQSVMGAFIGSAVHPELFFAHNVPFYACMLITVCVLLVSVLAGIGVTKIRYLPGSTGLWGTLPGAAPMMIILSEYHGADSRLVAFIQYARVVLVALIATCVVGNVQDDSRSFSWQSADDLSLGISIAVVLCSIAFASVIKVPAAHFLSAIVMAATAQYFLQISTAPQGIVLMTGFVFLGWSVGLRFSADIRAVAKKVFFRVVLLLLGMIACCYFFSCLLVRFFDVDPLTAYLATSPGGVDSIVAIAAGAPVDIQFIVSVQMIRFITLLCFGPAIIKFVFARLVKSSI